jgi:CheY-like chemotaxis protein
VPARTVREAEVWLRTGRPRALVLDIQLCGEDTWSFLARLRERPETRALPVVVVTNVDDERKALALGADAYGRPPVEKAWLLATLRRVTEWKDRRVLLVDDDDTARYLVRGLCRQLGLVPIEAAEGGEGLRRVAEDGPTAVLLDLVMPGMGGEEVLRRLRADAATERLPVVIVTSKTVEPAERQALESRRAVVFPKSLLGLPDAATLLADALRRAAIAASEAPVAHAAAAGVPS